jgi:hypothetical protein
MAAVIRTTTDAPTTSEALRLGLGRKASESLTASTVALLGKMGRASDALSTSESIRNTKFFRVTESLSATTVAAVGGPATIWKSTLNDVAQFDPGRGAAPFAVFEPRGTVPITYSTSDPPDLTFGTPSGGKVIYNDGDFGWWNPFQLVFAWGAAGIVVDHLTITESVSAVKTKLVSATDALTISEVARVIANATASDALTISESASVVFGRTRSTTDSPAVADSAGRIGAFVRSCVESLGTSESATLHEGDVRSTTETLVLSESLARIAVLHRSASESLATSESATASTVVHGIFRTANDALSTSENATSASTAHFVRTVSESLSTSEVVIRLLNTPRTANEALTIALVAFFHEALGRHTTEFLQISESAEREGGDKTRFAAEFLHIDELATRVRLAGPFVYLLPFPTGNLPVESNLVAQIAAGDFRIVDDLDHDVVTTSALAGPVSDSALVAWVSTSQLVAQVAESSLALQVAASQLAVQEAISSLIMQKAEGNLQYVQ